MRPYQEEYIENIREIAALTAREKPGELTFEAYEERLRRRERQAAEKVKRNMELLRQDLFPALDNLFEAGEEELKELEGFAEALWNGGKVADEGLFRMVRQALLSLARQKGDRRDMIRQLYWLGMGYHSLCSKLVCLEPESINQYFNHMRLSFTEAAAYLKYFDEIEDDETRSFIIRSRANMSLGHYKNPGERIRLIQDTLRILQDEAYRSMAPDLPWDRFVYMTHQLMASSISYSRNKVMTPEDIQSVMESAYIVYQQRLEEVASQGEPPMRWAYSYYTIQFYCGLFDFPRLMTLLEGLLNAADPKDHSTEGMYGVLSLPAFYIQLLSKFPEHLPERERYVDGLYRRALDYVDSFSVAERGRFSLYLRQLGYTYIETDTGVPFEFFVEKLMQLAMPEVYLHSRMVGEAARTLCEIICDEEPGFFDDIPEIRCLTDPEEKRERILSDALRGGLLHDVGKLNVMELYTRTTRQWLEEEYAITRLHTEAGKLLLRERSSTRRFAPVALGHHAWYDGSAHGYPESYKRLECPSRQMVDIVGLVDWIENASHSAQSYTGIVMTLDEAVEEAVSLEGRRFSPLLTARLRDERVKERLRQALEQGRREAYRAMYDQEK